MHTKVPILTVNVKQRQNATKKFDYTSIANPLRTVSLRDYSQPSGVVSLVYRPKPLTPRNSRVIKRAQTESKLQDQHGTVT